MADITSNLELFAQFEGNLNDSSGNGRNGTGFNSPTYGTGMVGSQSLDCEKDSSQYVSFGNNVGLDNVSAFSVFAWVKVESLTATQTQGIWGKDAGGSSRIGASIDSSGAIVFSNSNGGSHFGITAGPVLAVGQKVPVCCVFDGTQTGNANRAKVYIWGVPQTLTFTGTIPSTTPNNTSTPFFVGRQTTSSSGYLDGTVDQVRVYSRALSPADVAALAHETNENAFWFDNVNIHRSKYHWVDLGGGMQTTNCNAEIRFGFTGTSLKLLLSTYTATGANSNGSIEYEIDGSGTWTRADLSASQYEQSIATGLAGGSHTARIKYITYADGAGSFYTAANRFVVYGVVLDAAATLFAPSVKSRTALFFGDSHSIGNGIYGAGGTRDLRNARIAFPQLIADAINVECSTVGWGNIGYGVGGSNYPAVKNSWSEYYSGVSRLSGGAFAEGQPAYIFLNLGHNDGTGVQPDVEETITEIRAAAPDAIIFVGLPPNLNRESLITAAELAAGDANTHLIDHNENLALTGSYISADGVHLTPTGQQHYADLIVPLVTPFLITDPPTPSSGNSPSPSFSPGFSPAFSPSIF